MRIGFVSALALATALGITGAATVALGQGMSGDAWLYAGTLSIDGDLADYSMDDGSVTGAGARIGFGVSSSVAAQIDLTGEKVRIGNYPGDWVDDYSVNNVAAHVIYDTGAAKVGALVSFGGTDAWPYTPDASVRTIAIEGAFDAGAVQVIGQIGRTEMTDNGDLASNHIRFEGRFSLGGNLMGSANLGRGTIDYDSGDEVDFTTYGVEVEYRFPQGPYAVFAAYNGSKQDEASEDEDWTNTMFTLGVRIGFGDGDAPVFADYNPLSGIQHLRGGDWE